MHAIGLLIVSFFLFSTEKNLRDLNITYYNNKMRPYHDIEYFGLDADLSEESMTVKSLSKINTKLQFLYRKYE